VSRTNSTNGEKRNAYRILVGMAEGKSPLRRLCRRRVDNIKTDLTEIEWSCMDCVGVAQDRDQCRALVNTVMNFGFP
jgi:hypothetical protein